MAAAVDRWRENRAALARAGARPARAGPPARAARARGGGDRRRRACAPARRRRSARRLDAAQHGEAIARGRATLHEALAGEGRGARERVAARRARRAALARLDPRFEPLADRLAGLEAELEDVAAEARELAEAVDHDPAELAAARGAALEIYALERRYGDDEAAVIAHGERAAAEAERLRGLDDERRAPGRRGRAPAAGGRGRGRRRCRLPGRGPRRLGGAVSRGARGARLPGRRRSRSALGPAAGRAGRAGGRARRRRGRVRRDRASTRSSSGSPRTPASRPGRWPRSPRAAS